MGWGGGGVGWSGLRTEPEKMAVSPALPGSELIVMVLSTTTCPCVSNSMGTEWEKKREHKEKKETSAWLRNEKRMKKRTSAWLRNVEE